MKFQKDNAGYGHLFGSIVDCLRNFLWTRPIKPGVYIEPEIDSFVNNTKPETDGQQVIVIANHRPAVQRIMRGLEGRNRMVLAVEGGGMAPVCSIAFSNLNLQQARDFLEQTDKIDSIEQYEAFVPYSLAAALDWNEGERIAHWEVHLVSDDLESVLRGINGIDQEVPAGVSSSGPRLLMRFRFGSGLWLGQALLAVLPLIVFGFKALLLGELALLLAGLLLILIWEIPVRRTLMIVFAGICLALAAVFLLPNFFPNVFSWAAGIAYFLASIWIGMVFNGTRAG